MAYYFTHPPKDHSLTVIPGDLAIQRYPAKVAYGARRPRSSNLGGGAKPTSQVYRDADRRNFLNRAARAGR